MGGWGLTEKTSDSRANFKTEFLCLWVAGVTGREEWQVGRLGGGGGKGGVRWEGALSVNSRAVT